MQGAPEATIGLGSVFTLLFVTLGPLKILGPFAQQTRDVDEATMRAIAVRAFGLAVIAAVAGAFIGRSLLLNWHIPSSALLLAGGIVFFIVGLSVVLEQYQTEHAAPPSLPSAPMAAAMRITFPTVVTPYGIAALIVLLTNSHEPQRTIHILIILFGVMVLNFFAMLFARRLMGGITAMAFRILGAVLGVLQLALAVQMVFRALHDSGVLAVS